MRPSNTLTRAQQKNVLRDEAGVIVSVREQTTDDIRTSRHPGLLHQALADACAWTENLEGDWKIICISTPRTIAEDMRGRASIDTLGRFSRTPEEILLGKVGRLDLLERRHTVVVERGPLPSRRGRVRKPAA